jgi:ABC-type uncharacterized transport system substrate-binding protein
VHDAARSSAASLLSRGRQLLFGANAPTLTDRCKFDIMRSGTCGDEMQFHRLKRRELIMLLGGAAAAWPLSARAQQRVPVVGFVYAGSTSSGAAAFVTAFRRGLLEAGFVEKQNVAVEYRFPGNQDELPGLMSELVDRQVAVIVGNTPPAMAARKATSTIPIVFFTGTDPVTLGLVVSFNQPSGNATGVSFLASDLEAKRLGLLRDLVPQATTIAALVFSDQHDPIKGRARGGTCARSKGSGCAGQ